MMLTYTFYILTDFTVIENYSDYVDMPFILNLNESYIDAFIGIDIMEVSND